MFDQVQLRVCKMIYIPTGIQKGIHFNVCLLVYFSLARVTRSVTWPSRDIAVLLWFFLFFIFTAFVEM